jgi:hypothetical protein
MNCDEKEKENDGKLFVHEVIAQVNLLDKESGKQVIQPRM